MTHVVVTGAQGFVGRVLVRRLLEAGLDAHGPSLTRLTLMDVAFDEPPQDPRVIQLSGSIADPALRRTAFASPVDAVFHLASLPGGAAEKNYELGRSINLDATLGLLEDLRAQPKPARFVFASTIAVYGDQLPAEVTRSTQPAPALTYGAHKLASEILVADASRRGWIQGCSLRLPGVVARPGDGAGMMSAFMSQLFWRLREGERITVPVSPQGVAWWISVRACVDNLLRAATVDAAMIAPTACYQMPVLRFTVADLVNALAKRFGEDRRTLVTYAPDPFIEQHFAAYPPLRTPEAEAFGLRHDGTIDNLITNALAGA